MVTAAGNKAAAFAFGMDDREIAIEQPEIWLHK